MQEWLFYLAIGAAGVAAGLFLFALSGIVGRQLAHRQAKPARQYAPRSSKLLNYQILPNLNSVLIVLVPLAVAMWIAYQVITSPWPFGTTLRHLAAMPNCAAARAVGLAPSRRGQPGYWYRHDADSDGIACEPFLQRRSVRSLK